LARSQEVHNRKPIHDHLGERAPTTVARLVVDLACAYGRRRGVTVTESEGSSSASPEAADGQPPADGQQPKKKFKFPTAFTVLAIVLHPRGTHDRRCHRDPQADPQTAAS
jgi:hypothetical protein